MKKILLFALTAFMTVGCSNDNNHFGYEIITIDSCEYIRDPNYYHLIHKQNCKFCEKRNKQEIEELIKKFKEF